VEGFWTVEFEGVEGWGIGVIFLIGGQLFGGDEGYLYMGSYAVQGGTFSARVHVRPFVSGIVSVMGRSEFDLELSGLDMVGAGRQPTLILQGKIPGTDQTLKGRLTKQADLPPRA
jgi:hypothetical protein